MKLTFTDLRRNTGKVTEAMKRNEPVTVLYRGKAVATIDPLPVSVGTSDSAQSEIINQDDSVSP